MAGGEPQGKRSDLGVRTLSAIVMLAVAGAALWLGGYVWWALVLVVAGAVLFEWRRLVRCFAGDWRALLGWNIAGILYIGIAAATLLVARDQPSGFLTVLEIVCVVIATDVGAYFAGRTIGGPKIAPRISPSKTWAGLGGGMLLAAAVMAGGLQAISGGAVSPGAVAGAGSVGAVGAVIAQAGDFFESWMKRKAGVKDSSHLIPGHGGVFDRVDGLLAVCFMLGLASLALHLGGL
jgi:phosphatidate cytidylyltransferase